MKIQDKVILITGASGGIGKAAAELLSRRGARVAVAARSEDKIKTLAASLNDAYAVRVDMTDKASIDIMVKSVLDHYGRIDVLINNAGQSVVAPVMEIKIDDFKKIMDLNVYGPLLALQAVVPSMKENGGGMILHIGSMVSKMAIPNLGAYTATKYATNGLMLTARNELKDSNIIVSVLHPGATATNFGKNAIIGTDKVFTPTTSADTAEMVAEKIAEAIEHESGEYYMNEETERMYSPSVA
jgi:short-subunit dehydrogenase